MLATNRINDHSSTGGSRSPSTSSKPPLHANQSYYKYQNENEMTEIMEVSEETDIPMKQNLGSAHTQAEFVVDDDDDFMTRIVDGTCRGIFSSSDDDHDKHSLCHLPSCHLGDNLNVLMHCRQPLSFFSFFHEIQTEEGTEVVQLLPAGAYLMPTECEYCGKSDTKLCCPETCQRPRLYLQKKRPPFGKADREKWDPISDYAIPIPTPPPSPPPAPEKPILSPPRSPGSWVSDLFRRNGGGDSLDHKQ